MESLPSAAIIVVPGVPSAVSLIETTNTIISTHVIMIVSMWRYDTSSHDGDDDGDDDGNCHVIASIWRVCISKWFRHSHAQVETESKHHLWSCEDDVHGQHGEQQAV